MRFDNLFYIRKSNRNLGDALKKGTITEHWQGWVIAFIMVILLVIIFITGAHEIFIKKILDTIDVVIRIREVGP